MHPKQDVLTLQMKLHLAHLDIDFVANCRRALDHARAGADRALDTEGALQGLLHALAGNRDQPKIIELKHLGWSPIQFELVLQGLHHLVAVLTLVHVDKVDHDDSTQVAQTNLTNDLGDGIEVGLENRILEPSSLAYILAGVDVDGHQSLGLIDDDRSARLEPDLGLECLGDLILNAELLEERRLLGVQLDATHQRGLKTVQEANDALVLHLGIDPNGRKVVTYLVAEDALHQV